MKHTVEKIGGTSMSEFEAVRKNIICREPEKLYQRVFVVSAYGGVTDRLLEHKRTEEPGVFALFTDGEDEDAWRSALRDLREHMCSLNAQLFADPAALEEADAFIGQRLEDAEHVLDNLRTLCRHGHFQLSDHLARVREMLASLGEAQSAWNTARLLQRDGVNARFVDLTGWDSPSPKPLDEVLANALADVDLCSELPILTGYAHCSEGLMSTFDRGYSEMTFSRAVIISGAAEAIIHKEYHLSTADPRVVENGKPVPIGRTNYDVADQLASLGMGAIHPRAAKGLRQQDVPLRIKNTFDPEHGGTLITRDYISDKPCVEIIAGRSHVQAIELFDQDMVGSTNDYEKTLLGIFERFHAGVITKDLNANTLTHYLTGNLKTVKRILRVIEEAYPDAELNHRKVAIVSAIGSDMQVPGLLARAVKSLADASISVLALHQSMRQVDIQFVVDESDYHAAIRALHGALIEPHGYQRAIRAC